MSTLTPGWYYHNYHNGGWKVLITAALPATLGRRDRRYRIHYIREDERGGWYELEGTIWPANVTPITPSEDLLLNYMKWLTRQ